MPFEPVVLPTDALLWLLVALGMAFGIYAARHEHLRAPWAYVVRQPLAVAAIVVLAAYVALGLLDSLHYRARLAGDPADPGAVYYSPEIRSLLDLIATPLRTHVERTYSAPFALHAYTKETIELPDGKQAQIYPRLHYAGVGLTGPNARAYDIGRRLGAALLITLILMTVVVVAVAGGVRERGESLAGALRRLRAGHTRHPWRTLLVTLALVVFLTACGATLGPAYHVLGTDQVGRDVLYKSIKSIRTGLVIGTVATLVMLPFALLFGITAGYFRGWVDDFVQYVYTTLSSIPGVLLIAAAVLSLQVYMANHAGSYDTILQRADLRLLFLCLILGVTSWTGLCRLLRGETLKLRQMEYIQAATAFGVNHFTIMTRHILPNVMHIVLITVVLDFSSLVLAEAVLTYVGVGVDPGTYSWGNMINGARLEMARDPMVWWNLAAAFVFMFGLVLAANLFADAVRDAFDPRTAR